MKMKKLLAAFLAAAMTISMGLTAVAATQTVSATTPDDDNASITIINPAKGETYSVFKLFDATVSEDEQKIAYQTEGEIPSVLADFFTKDNVNYVHPADSIVEKDGEGKVIGTKMTDELKEALESWASGATAAATAESDGKDYLKFTGLAYGYYVMTTTHQDDEAAKALISVDSTKKDAKIYDKNLTKIEAKEKKVFNAEGEEIESVTIGDTVTYVAKFDTTNYVATDSNAQVYKYEISDTLPEFMDEVEIISVTVDGDELETTPQFENKKFDIAWTDGDGNHLYSNGAEIVVTYTAKITSTININTANTNTISIQPYTDEQTPWEEPFSKEAEIRTYAAAIKKVDDDGQPLPGAQFTIKGLEVEAGDPGVYTVVSYATASDAEESAVLDTDEDGKLYIVGLAEDVELTVTEFKAPDGYNKLTEPETLTPQLLSTAIYKESGTIYYDEKGNVVSEESEKTTEETVEKNLSELDVNALEIQNKKGVELPATGGTGTTMFYIIGSILVIGAGIVLVAKKRMNLK